MAKLNLKVYSKYRRLLYKYNQYPFYDVRRAPFRRLYDSIHVVYPDFSRESIPLSKEFDKMIQKRYRYKKRVKKMLDTFYHLYLVTLTFDDDCLESTSYDSRRKYVLRWCNDYCLDYFGCVDYGKKNGREHYHVICAIDDYIYPFFIRGKKFYDCQILKKWTYGFSSMRDMGKYDAKTKLHYTMKSCYYALKSHDEKSKPFSKRGVLYYDPSLDDDSLIGYNPYSNNKPYLYECIDWAEVISIFG